MNKLEAYFKLGEIEQRFNDSGAGVRTLASGWLLATLAGLGWLLDPTKGTDWPIPLGLLLSVVCTMAVAGIATLWVLDQLVFHRLLDAVFIVGLRMERADPTLPPIHAMMLKTIEGKGTHRWERFFYLVPLVVFAAFTSIVVIGGADSMFMSDSLKGGRGLAAVLLIAQVVLIVWVLMKQRVAGLRERIDWFADAEFSRMAREESFEKVLKDSSPLIHSS